MITDEENMQVIYAWVNNFVVPTSKSTYRYPVLLGSPSGVHIRGHSILYANILLGYAGTGNKKQIASEYKFPCEWRNHTEAEYWLNVLRFALDR